MLTLTLSLPAAPPTCYPIMLGADLLGQPEYWLPQVYHNKRIVIITDTQVDELYGQALCARLHDFDCCLLTCAPGEQAKSYAAQQQLVAQLSERRCDRDTLILALGGGVVGDLAGFIAATYLRGIAYLHLPTTLLAMVDSSIGGKTGINTEHGKNLIGAFWQPRGVVLDINCLSTLPEAQLVNGLIEALKMFLTHARAHFDAACAQLDAILQRDVVALRTVIAAAIAIKINVVSVDVREAQQRLLLNFGHTIGHALEKISGYQILHGYAVALGILVEAKIAQLLGLLPAAEYQRIKLLFLRLKISGQALKNWDSAALLQATHYDKKVSANTVQYVLLTAIGQVHRAGQRYVHAVADTLVQQALIEVSEG